ncbi:hypothetical protein PR003_g10298 [Phytophthora rubi]|uniref:Uncharacterized protein n=1 Tax=Phytophthora rubi TaxID=129364 RepID=A0A6A3JXN3_9STRA|nr:hypothetical protein PR001_g19422 [Phytophthora rubi]KAE9340821.1 hypothetical protein PR003_g10298 [Phytophthora rubi]
MNCRYWICCSTWPAASLEHFACTGCAAAELWWASGRTASATASPPASAARRSSESAWPRCC